MNNQTRKQASELQDRINAFKMKAATSIASLLGELKSEAEDIQEAIEAIRDGEQEKLDNLPDNMQGGEKEDAYTNAISELESAMSEMDTVASELEFEPDIESALDDAFSALDNARGY